MTQSNGEQLARVLKHPLRQRLLFEYADAVVSPSKVSGLVRQPLNVVSYHTAVLHRAGCLELVRIEQRRGAKEHYYRATAPRQIANSVWSALPVPLRRSLARSTLDAGWRDAGDSLAAGGMDDAEVHVSRSFLTLDRQALAALSDVLGSAFQKAEEIHAASVARGAPEAAPYELVIMSFKRASGPQARDGARPRIGR